MKTKFMIVALMFLQMGIVANAQEKQDKQDKLARPQFNAEKMDSMQCHHMVDDLLLNDATEAKFEPLYMKYLSDMRNLRTPQKTDAKQGNPEFKEQTDAEVQKMLEDRFSNEQKMLDLKVKYYKEFKRILSPKQLARIYQPQPRMNGQFGRMMSPRFENGGCPMMRPMGQKFDKSKQMTKRHDKDKQEQPNESSQD
jgi:hypothetical protein